MTNDQSHYKSSQTSHKDDKKMELVQREYFHATTRNGRATQK